MVTMWIKDWQACSADHWNNSPNPETGKDKSSQNLTKCTDSLILLASSFTELSQLHKEQFKLAIQDQYKLRLCSQSNKPSTYLLFSDDLSKQIEDINVMKALASKITSKSQLDFRSKGILLTLELLYIAVVKRESNQPVKQNTQAVLSAETGGK